MSTTEKHLRNENLYRTVEELAESLQTKFTYFFRSPQYEVFGGREGTITFCIGDSFTIALVNKAKPQSMLRVEGSVPESFKSGLEPLVPEGSTNIEWFVMVGHSIARPNDNKIYLHDVCSYRSCWGNPVSILSERAFEKEK